MIILFDPVGSPENLDQMIAGASSFPGVSGLMVLACDANDFDPENMDPVLRRASLPLFGGTFPGLVYGKELIDRGSLVVGLPGLLETRFVPGLSDGGIDYESYLDIGIPADRSSLTMMVFVDGIASRICGFVESLFNVFGLQMNYLGGGAGSLSMKSKPCLFTNGGMAADGAVLALFELASGIGVQHGWRPLSGPYRVTDSHLNAIRTLEWEPALEVYRQVVEKHSGATFDDANFFEISISYPFGILRFECEHIVRDALRACADKALVCIGEVPRDAFVYVLEGDRRSIIEAAGGASDLAVKAFPADRRPGLHILMDCISRVLYLGDRFTDELEAVRREGAPMVGACTIGEIANCGTEFLEFYNKTAVVAVLEDG